MAELDRSVLERRYRWLLGWYPHRHRAEYGDEMLGVLMADGGGGGRWPGPAAVADLVRGGTSAWLGWARGGLRAGGWPAVGGALGLLLPFAMVAYSLPLDVDLVRLWPEYQGRHLETLFYPETALVGWAVVLGLALTRRWRVTVAVAWVLAAFQVVVFGVEAWGSRVPAHLACWPAVAVLSAVALTVRGAPVRRWGVLGPLGFAAGLGACLAALLVRQPSHLTFPLAPVGAASPGLFLAGQPARVVLVALAAGLFAVVAVRVTRRAGAGVTLRLVAVLAGLGVLFWAGRLEALVLTGTPYLGVRWLLAPALVVALFVLAARLVDRQRAHRLLLSADGSDTRGP